MDPTEEEEPGTTGEGTAEKTPNEDEGPGLEDLQVPAGWNVATEEEAPAGRVVLGNLAGFSNHIVLPWDTSFL